MVSNLKFLAFLLLLSVLYSCDQRGEQLWEDEKNQIRTYLQDKGVSNYNENPEAGYFYYFTDSIATGGRPNSASVIEVIYRIESLDGTVFIESDLGVTERINLSQSIVGLQLGMSNFSVGTKGFLILPSRLAYGKKGYTNDYGDKIIPANTVLVVYVELVEVHPHF